MWMTNYPLLRWIRNILGEPGPATWMSDSFEQQLISCVLINYDFIAVLSVRNKIYHNTMTDGVRTPWVPKLSTVMVSECTCINGSLFSRVKISVLCAEKWYPNTFVLPKLPSAQELTRDYIYVDYFLVTGCMHHDHLKYKGRSSPRDNFPFQWRLKKRKCMKYRFDNA